MAKTKSKAYVRARAGASLILALFFIMFCIILGSSVLVAGTSVARHSAENTKENQTSTNTQNMYSLECAANLVTTQIDNQAVVVVTKNTENSTNEYKYYNFCRDDYDNVKEVIEKGNKYSSSGCLLTYLVSNIYEEEKKKSTYSTTVTLKDKDDAFGTIRCEITINSAYNITAILQNESDTNSREIELVFNSTTSTSDESNYIYLYWTLQ